MKTLKKSEIKKLFKEYKRDLEIVLVLEDIQYARNVASIFRTADAAGVSKIILTGISQMPPFGKDLQKASRNKEKSVLWKYEKDTGKVINSLRANDFSIAAIELTDTAEDITNLRTFADKTKKIALILGSEVFGIKRDTLGRVEKSFFIPMYGKGASLNVSTTAGIALYYL